MELSPISSPPPPPPPLSLSKVKRGGLKHEEVCKLATPMCLNVVWEEMVLMPVHHLHCICLSDYTFVEQLAA